MTVSRDRVVDAVRAYAVVGVILGHWLVTGLAPRPDGSLGTASPLAAMPALAPATWLCQTLGLFFFAAGYGSGRSLRRRGDGPEPYRRWLRRRLGRLLPGAAVLAGCAVLAVAAAPVLGMPAATGRTVATLLLSPLWFLVPFAVLVALAGPLRRLLVRPGPAAVAVPVVAVVIASDLCGRWRPTFAPTGRTAVAVVAVWLVPYLIGLMVADGRLGGRRAGWGLALGGMAGLATLVLVAGYPASAVGVPGDGRSNLNPPSLFPICLAAAQIGAVLLLRPALTRLLRRPRWWSPVRRLNRSAATVYLAHQPVLLVVAGLAAASTGGSRGAGGDPAVPGLLTAPDGPAWLAARMAWLPVFALVLAGLLAAARSVGGVGARNRSRRDVARVDRPDSGTWRTGCTMAHGSEPCRLPGGDRCAR